jgi:hypothetical protein
LQRCRARGARDSKDHDIDLGDSLI